MEYQTHQESNRGVDNPELTPPSINYNSKPTNAARKLTNAMARNCITQFQIHLEFKP